MTKTIRKTCNIDILFYYFFITGVRLEKEGRSSDYTLITTVRMYKKWHTKVIPKLKGVRVIVSE